MTGDRPPVRVSGSVELNLDQVAERLAALITAAVLAGLVDAGIGIMPADTGERGEAYNPAIDHKAAPQVGYFDAGAES